MPCRQIGTNGADFGRSTAEADARFYRYMKGRTALVQSYRSVGCARIAWQGRALSTCGCRSFPCIFDRLIWNP